MVVCGRRWGKTAAALQMVLRGHGTHRGHRRGAVDGAKIWWVAPDYPTLEEVIWPDLMKAVKGVTVRKPNQQAHRVELMGGGMITLKSASDPDKLVGVGLDGLVMDEAADIAPEAWRESLRATIADKQGWATFISTPNGHNWFHDLFETAGVDSTHEWEAWQRPSRDNPLMTEAELRSAEIDSGPQFYQQEYEAQFTDVAGAEFPGECFGSFLWIDDDRWPRQEEFQFHVLALDPSKGKTDKADDSAFVKLSLHQSGVMYIDAEIDLMHLGTLASRTLEICREFNPVAVGIEAVQFQELLGIHVAAEATRVGRPISVWHIDHTMNKHARIRSTLTQFVMRKEFRFRRSSRGARKLVSQLQEFPKAKHDDGPDALEMAVSLARMIHSGPSGESHWRMEAA